MVDMLSGAVDHRTRIGEGYRQHAAVQSIDSFMADWLVARDLLDRRILELLDLRAERTRQIDAGEWPARKDPTCE